MAEYKGKPSGKIAPNKKSPGRQGDLKEKGRVAGARKKTVSKSAGVRGVTGTSSRSR